MYYEALTGSPTGPGTFVTLPGRPCLEVGKGDQVPLAHGELPMPARHLHTCTCTCTPPPHTHTICQRSRLEQGIGGDGGTAVDHEMRYLSLAAIVTTVACV